MRIGALETLQAALDRVPAWRNHHDHLCGVYEGLRRGRLRCGGDARCDKRHEAEKKKCRPIHQEKCTARWLSIRANFLVAILDGLKCHDGPTTTPEHQAFKEKLRGNERGGISLRSISVVPVFGPAAFAVQRISFAKLQQDFLFPLDLCVLRRLVFQRFTVFVFDVHDRNVVLMVFGFVKISVRN